LPCPACLTSRCSILLCTKTLQVHPGLPHTHAVQQSRHTLSHTHTHTDTRTHPTTPTQNTTPHTHTHPHTHENEISEINQAEEELPKVCEAVKSIRWHPGQSWLPARERSQAGGGRGGGGGEAGARRGGAGT